MVYRCEKCNSSFMRLFSTKDGEHQLCQACCAEYNNQLSGIDNPNVELEFKIKKRLETFSKEIAVMKKRLEASEKRLTSLEDIVKEMRESGYGKGTE